VLQRGLRTHGFDDVASELARRTIAMQARGGIREFYDPVTARPTSAGLVSAWI
jgi:hypothetical protein